MLIGEIERNPTERLRVSIENFKGREYVDVRIYYQDKEEEWRPTKKGVTVAPEKTEEFIALINEAHKKLAGGGGE